jgi:hypothetical protein
MTETAFVILTARDARGGAETRIIPVAGAAASEIVARAAVEHVRGTPFAERLVARSYVPATPRGTVPAS